MLEGEVGSVDIVDLEERPSEDGGRRETRNGVMVRGRSAMGYGEELILKSGFLILLRLPSEGTAVVLLGDEVDVEVRMERHRELEVRNE